MIFSILESIRGWLMPPPFWVHDLGRRGEYLARRHFHRRGYHVLAQRWRHGHHELDLIMANHRQLIFIEVKTRTTRPGREITRLISREQKRGLMRTAKAYLQTWPDPVPWRFLLVVVRRQRTRQGKERFNLEVRSLSGDRPEPA